MYKAIITVLTNVRDHPGADRLDLATVCGNQVVIGKGHSDGDVGVYFDVDGALTPEFASKLNLFRHEHLNKDKKQKGMFDDNGRVRAQAFRGSKSEGFWLPIATVQAAFKKVPTEVGTEFDMIEKILICKKYINPKTLQKQGTQKSTKKLTNAMFKQHFDTSQFGRNEFMIKDDDVVIITEKLHGTSQRFANVKVTPEPKWYQKLFNIKPTPVWKDMIGTRRVILSDDKIKEDNGFHTVNFRQRASRDLIGNVRKGETFYYEVVGYEEATKPIMGSHSNEKLKGHLDKESYKRFIDTYGGNTIFSYGCSEGECDIYIYRITLTNEDGYSVDLTWDAVVERCEELGIKTVPELARGSRKDLGGDPAYARLSKEELENGNTIEDGFQRYVKTISEGKSTVGHNLSEGVCLRVEKGITPLVLKEKNFEFKCLEGIIKDSGFVDAEEAEC